MLRTYPCGGDPAVLYQAYLEVGNDGSCLAWVVDLPAAGCHTRAPERAQALAALPGEIAAYLDMLRRRGYTGPLPPPAGVAVAGEWQRRGGVANGRTSATFAPEQEPIARDEVAERLKVLACSRAELLDVVRGLPDLALDWPEPGKPAEAATIRNQLQHVADAERWYLERLGLPLPALPRSRSPLERLERVRALGLTWLRGLTEADLARCAPHMGETWSVRKVLRRMAYHEWFHLQVIRRILERWQQAPGN